MRTPISIICLALIMVWCVLLLRDRGATGSDMFHYATVALYVMAGIAAGHSTLQYATDGSGMFGAFKNIFTENKPPDHEMTPPSEVSGNKTVNISVQPPAEVTVEKKP